MCVFDIYWAVGNLTHHCLACKQQVKGGFKNLVLTLSDNRYIFHNAPVYLFTVLVLFEKYYDKFYSEECTV